MPEREQALTPLPIRDKAGQGGGGKDKTGQNRPQPLSFATTRVYTPQINIFPKVKVASP